MSKDKEAVLNYLENVNRPYSASDIHKNMHSECTKIVIQKALDQLVTENKIREKIYNKQKIYSSLQGSGRNIHEIEKNVQHLESEIFQKLNVLKELEEELKSCEYELRKYESLLTKEEAEKKKNELQSDIKNLETKLKLLSDNKIFISKEDSDKIKENYTFVLKTYKKRKHICMDILYSILENYPKNKTLLMEEIGIELDDENVIATLKM